MTNSNVSGKPGLVQMRACLAEEFTDLYVFHLRGNQRTSGERSRKEGGKVFGSGSRAPIAISVFVKNPDAADHGRIFIHDIGDYLDQKQKLTIIRDFGAVKGISNANAWERITPDDQNDWLNQRDASFDAFMKIGDKKDKTEPYIFSTYSLGVATGRDAWCYNSSPSNLRSNMKSMISEYDRILDDFVSAGCPEPAKNFVRPDPKKISWNDNFTTDLSRNECQCAFKTDPV